MSVYGEATDLIPVGDPRRALIGRAAIGVVLAAAVFFVFTATKQIKPVYLHAPWGNDPYDTVFSFTMFFVPLVVACFLVQVSLCRKSEALPTSRVVTIVRGCRVAVGGIVIELLSAWVAVAIGANRSQWSGATTGALIGLLSLCTVVTGKVMVDLHRVPRLANADRVPVAAASSAAASDWLADVVTVAERESRWLGPLRRPALSMLGWTDRNLVRHVRRHPLAAAAVASGGFAVVVFGWQAIREGYFLPETLVAMGLGFCGMFAFLVLAGSYLGIARSPKALSGLQRRAVDASVAACAVAIGTLAFRDSLWWIVGSTSAAARLPQFATLLGSTTLLALVVVFAAETVLRSHQSLSGRRGPRRS
jgi:hypothetical protein